ncbi:MAG: nicotinate (nicotinamide) nucleotide adenylyltransferase [Burkholderiaceae bacterium]|jgi:nicotinate-nucleotide adenylyltransferase|nr:nicotinate (nicotinamide) nucleotide adenylyltransferase [Burkholderiaceae bacterium]
MVLSAPRIGVFGGAFDPPHNAHVTLAACALAQLGLTQLRIFPTGQPWHKGGTPSAADDRLAMARLAFAGMAGAVVDAREMVRAGPTYTLETLLELQAESPRAELVLVLGADQALALPGWHRWLDILALAVVAVAQRAGSTQAFDLARLPGLPQGMRTRFVSITLPPMDISATEIRRRAAAAGQDLRAWVPPAVARYIEQHRLYQPQSSTQHS